MNKFAIVVQGPTDLACLNVILNEFAGYTIIYSTWDGQVARRLLELSHRPKGGEFLVHLQANPKISGVANLNLQKLSTLGGLERARAIGFKRVLKWRSDQVPVRFQSALLGLENSKSFGFLHWHEHRHGYLVDYAIFGEIDDVATLFDVSPFGPYPEYNLTANLFGSGLNRISKCFGDLLDSKGPDIFWPKKGIYLSSNNQAYGYSSEVPMIWRGFTLAPDFDERKM